MTSEQIAADIERGAFLTERIKADQAELKAIVKRLEAAALNAPHLPLKDKDREGKQALLRSGSRSLPVIFESDLLIGSFKADSELAGKVRSLITKQAFTGLFKEVHSYERRIEDGQKFRIEARKTIADETLCLEVLSLLKAKNKDGITKSKTVIAWDQLPAVPA
jgi:hypothetical protein